MSRLQQLGDIRGTNKLKEIIYQKKPDETFPPPDTVGERTVDLSTFTVCFIRRQRLTASL